MSTAEIADVQAGTKAVNVATAVAAAITAADGKLLYIEPGDYLVNSGFTIPAGYTGSIYFKPQAKFWAGANSITFFTAGSNWFGGQLHNCWLEGNGKTGVIGLDLSNFRAEGAGIVFPVMQNMASGIIYRSACFDTILDEPYMVSVTAPITIISNCGGIQIRNPNLDTYTTGIDIQAGGTPNIGVQVIGGYIQGGTDGIKDAGTGTRIMGTYFENNTASDVLFTSAQRSSAYGTQHFAAIGAQAFKGTSSSGISIIDPAMASSGRSTGLFNFDGTNDNCVAYYTPTTASLNVPAGTITGLSFLPIQVTGTATPVVIGTSAAGVGTYTGTPRITYSKTGNTVHFNLSVTWSAHTGTGNIQITGLPYTPTSIVARRVFLCIPNLAFTGPLIYAFLNGTGSDMTLVQVDAAGSESFVGITAAGTLHISGSYEMAG